MLKFQPILTAAAGALVVVPAVTLDDADLGSLQSALNDTTRAIEVLTGLQQRIDAGDPAAADMVERVTEAPILDPRSRDERLETLRNEVGLLHTEFDLLEARAFALAPPPMPGTGSPGTGALQPNQPAQPSGLAFGSLPQAGTAPVVSSGLSQADRMRLSDLGLPPKAGGTAPASDAAGTTPGPGTIPVAVAEGDGPEYSADPVRHARACLRAGRYQEGVDVLRNSEDPEAMYVKARCLEKLGRLDEAIETLTVVVAQSPEGYQAERAKSDLEFFQWKRDFLALVPEAPAPEVSDAGGSLDTGSGR